MSLKRTLYFVFLTLIMLGTSIRNDAADFKLPENVKAGDLFVVSLLPASDDKQVSLKFNSAELQFMGAVQGTPDIQINSDSEITIKPEGGSFAAVYELKFLNLMASGASKLIMADASGDRALEVIIKIPEVERTYSWIILAAAVILLLAGLKIWRYQKSAPAMMSTKSLFMSYEELEKARKMYFPEDNAGAGEKKVGESATLPANSRALNEPKQEDADKESKPSSGKATLKEMPAAGPSEQSKEHLKKRLAMVFSSDQNEPVVVPQVPELSELKADNLQQKTEPIVEEKPTLPVSSQPAAGAVDSTAQRPGVSSAPPPKPGLKLVQAAEKMVFAIEDGSGRLYEATGPVVKIGRRKENQICLTASEISREHVEITIDQGKLFVRALSESNITRLNDRTVKDKMQVKPGDKLNMGGTDFIVRKARPA